AVQVHVAHAATVKGAGVIAGGPYYCAQGNLRIAYENCLQPGASAPLPSLERLREAIETLAEDRAIDPPAHLRQARVWLFHGRNDGTVAAPVVQRLRALYASYGADVALVEDVPAGHGMPTARAGNACATSDSPFLNACGFDAAGALLGHLLGPLQAPAAGPPRGRLERFDQSLYAGGSAPAVSLDEEGFVYVPEVCRSRRCEVHVAFHGCRQGAGDIGERFVREAGYNPWADANGIVVLYPQAIARRGVRL